VDKVQAIKWESPAGGGTEDSPYPSEIDPNKDALDARGIYLQKDSGSDTKVYLTRDDKKLVAVDDFVPTSRALYQFPYGWRTVPAGQERTISGGYDHTVTDLIIEDSGSLIIEENGRLVLVG